MDIQQRIDADIKQAMLARDKQRLDVLRAIKSALLLEATKQGGDHLVGRAAGLRILQKLHKQRLEAAAIYAEQQRPELAREEEAQARVLEEYLPQPLEAAQLEKLVEQTLQAMGATGMADMGRAMKEVNAKVAGRADGATVATVVKKLLSNR